MCQRQKNGRGPSRKLGVGPSAKIIEPFAIRAARRLRRGGDPHDEVGALGLYQQLRRRLCALVKTGHVNEHHARTPVEIEQVFRGTRRCRQRSDGAPYLLCQCIQEARLSRVDLADQDDPYWHDGLSGGGHVTLPRGAQVLVRQRKSTGVEVN